MFLQGRKSVQRLRSLHEVLMKKEKECKESKEVPRSRRSTPRRKTGPPQTTKTPNIRSFFPGRIKTGSTTTTTTVSGRGTAVLSAANTNTREEWPGPSMEQDTKPPDILTQKSTQLLGVVRKIGTEYSSSECQPTHPDVNLCEEGGRVSAVVAGSVRRGVRRQKEEMNNIVVQTTTTTKVSPVLIDNNCVVGSKKMMSGRLNVRQLSERFNALSEGCGEGGRLRPDPYKRPGEGDGRLGRKKTFEESDVMCPGNEERRRGWVKDVQTIVSSRTFQGEIKGRGFPCGGQSGIETDDSADTRHGSNFGELGQETARR